MIDYNYSNIIISFEKLYEKFQFSSFNLLIQYKQLHSESNNNIIIMIINCLSSPLSMNAYWLKKCWGVTLQCTTIPSVREFLGMLHAIKSSIRDGCVGLLLVYTITYVT